MKNRIKELMKYRKHGITKLEGIVTSLNIAIPDNYTTADCHDCERVKDKKKLQVCNLTHASNSFDMLLIFRKTLTHLLAGMSCVLSLCTSHIIFTELVKMLLHQ